MVKSKELIEELRQWASSEAYSQVLKVIEAIVLETHDKMDSEPDGVELRRYQGANAAFKKLLRKLKQPVKEV